MNTEQLVNYLHECENEQGFIPWDDDKHAIENLITVFELHPEYARAIVEIAQSTTKAASN